MSMNGVLMTMGGVGLLFAALGIPLALGKVPPNVTYGFRTRRTLSNEKLWYQANRTSGRVIVVGGVVIIGAVLGILGFCDTVELSHVTGVTLLVLAAAVGSALAGAWSIRRSAVDREGPGAAS